MQKFLQNLRFKILVAFAFILLFGTVALTVFFCHIYYDYQQYKKNLIYTMSGSTSVVTTVDEAGTEVTLTPLNRKALYAFLSNSSGKRTLTSDAELTGRYIEFTAKSAVTTTTGRISETDAGCVKIEAESGDKDWSYYIENNIPYDNYAKVASPGGWTTPNE